VSFQEAVQTVLTQKYADFSGRARRSEYWWFSLANFLASVVLGIIDQIIGTRILEIVLFVAMFVPGLAVAIRRLHDTGRSGWWWLIGLTGIGLIVLLVWFVTDSDPSDNQYGPSPKGAPGWTPNPGPDPTWGQS
jgi:uncharacterized membrane protein YhaH (DUF805 family)